MQINLKRRTRNLEMKGAKEFILMNILKEIHWVECTSLQVLMIMFKDLRIMIQTNERKDLIVIIEREKENQNLEGYVVVGAVNVIIKRIPKRGIINKNKAFLVSNQSYSQMPRKNGAFTPTLKIAKNKIISNHPLIIFKRRILKLRKLKISNH